MRVVIVHDSDELYLLVSQYLAIEWPEIEVESLALDNEPGWQAGDIALVGAARDAAARDWIGRHAARAGTPPLIAIADDAPALSAEGWPVRVVARAELGRGSLAEAVRDARTRHERDDRTLDLRKGGAPVPAAPRAAPANGAPPAPGVAVHRDTGKAILIRGYRVLSKIGEGGMASVFLSRRESDGAEVVLKILDSSLTQEDDQLQRFMHEFSIISQFDSPYVVKIHDQGFTDDHVFIVMEYFARGDLKARLRNGISRRHALQVLFHIGCALEVIHAAGVTHRDLKPQNVMFRADRSLAVADFGISKEAVPDPTTVTLNSTIMGTPFYISPEMIDSRHADARSDIYSLGVMFYEMLMGVRPFEATSVMMLLYKHTHEAVPRLPPELQGFQVLMDRMLAKNPDERFPNAGALLDYVVKHWHADLA